MPESAKRQRLRMLCGVGNTDTCLLIRQFLRSGSMNVSVYKREIYYDFSNAEVDFLKSLELWDELKNKLNSYEQVTIEGYVRYEQS
jgi:hypothetical protein